jgi:hypothetical protein
MPLDERRDRYTKLFDIIAANDVRAWSERFMAALLQCEPAAPTTTTATVGVSP